MFWTLNTSTWALRQGKHIDWCRVGLWRTGCGLRGTDILHISWGSAISIWQGFYGRVKPAQYVIQAIHRSKRRAISH